MSTPVACSVCGLRDVCYTGGTVHAGEGAALAADVHRRRVRAGEKLYLRGQPTHKVYAVRSGFLTQNLVSPVHGERILSWHVHGDLLGLDGIAPGVCQADAVAVCDSEVCEVDVSELTSGRPDRRSVWMKVGRQIAREVDRTRRHSIAMRFPSADERMAAFLLELSRRYSRKGYSARHFHLYMTRQQIARYLGLATETVSRTLARMQRRGLIALRRRELRLFDLDALARISPLLVAAG
jgi:CRP/FNR family transcriptional regulator